MVTVSFYYSVETKHEENGFIQFRREFKEGEKSFDSPEKAKRFCYGMSRKKGVHVSGWKCDSIEENEYMTRNVNLSRINGF